MTDYYTALCTICEKPIRRVDLSDGPCWHHREVEVCRANIRTDEAARHHDGGDCECTSVYTVEEFKTAIRSVLDEAKPGCGCWTCNTEERWMRMFICPVCGNKRCPRATDHRNACTGSNDPGQPGSRYGGLPT